MSWAERLLGLSAGDRNEVPLQVKRLPGVLARGLQSLARCAELAPTPTAETEVHHVIQRVEALYLRLSEALKNYAPTVISEAAQSEPPLGQNHWARLVSALEHHREARDELIEGAMAVAEDYPQLGAQLEQLGREEASVIEELRNLIARADPQASD